MAKSIYVLLVALTMCVGLPERAHAQCAVFEGGTVKDVFNNTVYNNGGQWVNLGTYDDSTCTFFAQDEVSNLAFTACVNRGSGVVIAISGQVWNSSGAIGFVQAPTSCRAAWGLNYYSALAPGHKMFPLDSILPPNNSYTLDYQTDGNFVIYGPTPGSPFLTTPVWAANCWSTCFDWGTAGYAEMTTGGNLRLVNGSGSTVWQTGTSGLGAFLVIRNSGQLVIYNAAGQILWTN